MIYRFCAVILAVFMTAIASSDVHADPSKQFEALVLERMPGFKLTRKWIGRPVSVSPAYAIEVQNRRLAKPTAASPVAKELVIADLVAHHEKTGLPPARIYSWSGSFPSDHWRVDFPGCTPGTCVDQVAASKFTPVSREDTRRFNGRLNFTVAPRRVDIVAAKIGEVNYQALLQVYYDHKGRVIRYTVEAYKDITTSRERRWFRRQGIQNGPLPIPVFYYSNNLVLSVDKIIYFGKSNGVSPRDLRLRGL